MKFCQILIVSFSFMIFFSSCESDAVLIDFEDLSSLTPAPVIDQKYFIGEEFIENPSGVKLKVLPFKTHATTDPWCISDPFCYLEVINDDKSGGKGNEIHFHNVNLGVISPTNKKIKQISLKFGDYGGNVNLIENGVLHNPKYDPTLETDEKFIYISSPTASGLNIEVQGDGDTNPQGILKLSGTMEPFIFTFPGSEIPDTIYYAAIIGGGQEVWIDDIEIVFE